MNFRIRNKWVVLAGAMLALMTIGSIYSWSLFNAPIAEAYGWSQDEVVRTYSIAIFFFAFSTLVSGRLQISKGPRVTALIGGLLYSGGVILSAFAKTPMMLYLTYGVIAGSGVGFVYVAPLATLVKWFPKHKGTFTGVSVGTFASGSIIFKSVISKLLGNGPCTPEVITSTFIKVGLIYLVVSVLGSLLLDVPEITESKEVAKASSTDFTPSQMVKTGNFFKLFFAFLMATMPGILVIGLAKDIGVELVNLDVAKAAGIVSIIAVFNACGRLLSGILSDKIGALNVLKIVAIITIVSLGILSFVELTYVTFMVAILGIVLGYGSFLALFPTIVASFYGSSHYSANYGIVYQGYGLAALVGPIIKANSSGYGQTFLISMIIAIVGFVLITQIKQGKTEVHNTNIELCEEN